MVDERRLHPALTGRVTLSLPGMVVVVVKVGSAAFIDVVVVVGVSVVVVVGSVVVADGTVVVVV